MSKMSCLFSCALLLCVQTIASAQIPDVPEIELPDPDATGPGAYPNTSVTSAMFQVVSPPGIRNGGDNQDQILVSVPNSGPIPWTTNRYNEGDFAIQLSPADVEAANEFLGTSPPWTGSAAELEYKYEDSLQPQTQVWNLSSQVGVMLATAAQNVVSWDDGLPDYYPTVALSRASSGRGYDMVGGTWGTGGIDLNTGTWGSIDEANFSAATAWFPFQQGWIGGWMGGTDEDGNVAWSGEQTFSPQFENVDPANVMTWTDVFENQAAVFESPTADFGALGKLSLSELDVHSMNDGMLFTISDDGSSSTNVTSAAPLEDGSGWIYSNREDSQAESDVLADGNQASFGFVYVPYNAPGLVGGHINGEDATTINGNGEFAISKVADGSYQIQVGDRTPENGVLMLANAGLLEDSTLVAGNNHLSYEWNAEANSFDVQARHFDGDVVLEDTDFYFMWVDFENPLRLNTGGGTLGDCNGDGEVSADDLQCIVGSDAGTVADVLSATGLVAGDLNADGEVAFSDFLTLSGNFGKMGVAYVEGDVDGDGEVAFSDFLTLSGNFGKTGAVAASVPEPSSCMLIVGGLLLMMGRRTRR